MGVAPRSEAMQKYAKLAVVRMMTASWWKSRVPRGRCARMIVSEGGLCFNRDSTYHEVEHHRSQEGERDESECSPQPVRTMGANVEGRIWRVEVEGVVGHRGWCWN